MKTYEIGQKIEARYKTAVYKPALSGWRQETVWATLEVISPGKAKVLEAYLEPARSKRQWFSPSGIAAREQGKTKIISKLRGVEIVEA